MAWQRLLDNTATQSEELYISQPFVLFVEGVLGSRIVSVEMRRNDGTTWMPVNLNGTLVATDPLVVLGGIPDTRYRVNVDTSGIEVYWNIAYPSRQG